MDALEAILSRRSTRSYGPGPVEKEKLDIIIEAGRQAPSGGNSQTNHFFVIQSRETLECLIGMTQQAFARMEAYEGMYPSLRHSIEASKRGGYVFTYGAPVLIVVANRLGYGNNIADAACAIENMMVAANALELGSCWINQLRWLNEDEQLLEYMRSYGLKEDERVYGAVIIGHAEGGVPRRGLTEQKGNAVTYID